MGAQDLIVTPIYLLLFYGIALVLKNKLSGNTTRKYFIVGLTIKFFGAICLGLIYQFYYGGGDTFNFWTYGSSHIWNAFVQSPAKGLSMIFSSSITPELWENYTKLWFINSDSTSYLIRVIGFIDLLTLHTYSATALFFALISFSGSWALFTLLSRKYPGNERRLFISIFLVPSMVLWGSGIMKDTITLSAFFWMLWSVVRWFDFKSRSFVEIIVFVIAFYFSYKIKIYVLICLIPCIIFYVALINIKGIKSVVLKIMIAPMLGLVFAIFGYFTILKLGEANERYQLDNIAHWSQVTANDLRYWTGSGAGSGYSLGSHDGTWGGMLRMAPAGVFTAIFRPFIWESSNVFMLMNAIESLVMLVIFLGAIFKSRVRLLRQDSFLAFCLLFAVIFAFAVGVSTFNFGSLSRYRIPLIPLFLIAMLVKPNFLVQPNNSNSVG